MTRLDRLTERLNLKEFQLRALLDVTKAINNNLGHDELLQLYARIMHDELGMNTAGSRQPHRGGKSEYENDSFHDGYLLVMNNKVNMAHTSQAVR